MIGAVWDIVEVYKDCDWAKGDGVVSSILGRSRWGIFIILLTLLYCKHADLREANSL